jgi:hypothetical protein
MIGNEVQRRLRMTWLVVGVGVLALLASDVLTNPTDSSLSAKSSASSPSSAYADAPSSSACGEIVPSPNPYDSQHINDLWVSAENDVWAVGSYFDYSAEVGHGLIMRWDGNQWLQSPSPSIGRYSVLTAVAAVSADDAWAVGYYDLDDPDSNLPLTLHWNGQSWRHVPAPNPGGRNETRIEEVGVSPTGVVWAAGWYIAEAGGGGVNRTLIMKWDGVDWNIVPSPNVGSSGNSIRTLEIVADNDIWAGGLYYDGTRYATLLLHWDGISWSIVPSPNIGAGHNFLQEIAGVGSSSIWAVGFYVVTNDGARQPLSLYWDGSSWINVPVPSFDERYVYLYGLDVKGPNDIWAVGRLYNSTRGYWDSNNRSRNHGRPAFECCRGLTR